MVLRYLFFSIIEIVKLTRYFKRKKFDLIHVSGGSWQFKGVIAGKLAGIKVIWHLNDTFAPKAIRMFFYFFSRFSDGFIYASIRSKEYYDSITHKKIPSFIIPAPVDTNKYNPYHEFINNDPLVKSWEGKTVIGMVANISPVKSIETFIRASEIINNECDNIVFVVIGSQYKSQKKYLTILEKMMTKLSISNIDFIGSVSDVRSFLKRFNIYVCCSDFESSPMSVWEAMAMEKPIISTDVGDVSQFIKDEENGFIINTKDYHTLAKRLIRLINDKQLCDKFGKKARITATTSLDISMSAKKHIDAYKAIIKAT